MTASLAYYTHLNTRRALSRAENEIAQRKHAEAELHKLTLAVEQSPATVLITDAQGTIQYVNPRFSKDTGYRFEEVAGKNPRVLQSGETVSSTYRQMWDALSVGNEWCGELVNRRKDGSLYHVLATISPVIDDECVTTNYLAVQQDITDRKRHELQLRQAHDDLDRANQALLHANAELNRLAETDALTGLWNRRHFELAVKVAVAQAKRQGTPLSLLMFDIDFFKKVNDNFGHEVGDQVLVGLTELIRTNLRGADVLSRWGGEEFVILLSDCSSYAAMRLAEKLRAVVARHRFPGVSRITISIGVTEIRPEDNQHDWFSRVDKALYEAKSGGRNQVRLG